MKFRKKPVEIEAMLFDGSDESAWAIMKWAHEGLHPANNAIILRGWHELMVRTLEGQHVASIGDWIIKGVKGEFYPCKPDIFALTYEAVAIQESQESVG